MSLTKGAVGLGLPAGAGRSITPDRSLEPIRYPLIEFRLRDERVTQNVLRPGVALELEVIQAPKTC